MEPLRLLGLPDQLHQNCSHFVYDLPVFANSENHYRSGYCQTKVGYFTQIWKWRVIQTDFVRSFLVRHDLRRTLSSRQDFNLTMPSIGAGFSPPNSQKRDWTLANRSHETNDSAQVNWDQF